MRKITLPLILLAFFAFCTTSKAQVVINEIVSSNASLNVDEDGDFQDWVELYNAGSSAVNLGGFGLTDDPLTPEKWTFPAVTLNPGQYLLVYCSDKNRTVAGQPLHTNWKISSGGETVLLTNASGVTVDQVPPTAIEEDFSYGRFPNGTGPFVFFDDVTPAALNATTGYNEVLDEPTFSQAGGFFTSAFNLTISSAETGVTILYTLDGSEPDAANIGGHTYQYRNSYNETGSQTPGPLLTQSFETLTFSAPINVYDRSNEPNKISMISSTYSHDPSFYLPDGTIFKGMVVRAKVIKPGAMPSQTVSQTYFVTPQGASRFNLPVVSLSLTESDFYDYNDGIYVAGKDFDDWRAANPTENPSGLRIGNYHRRGEEFEKRANMTYFVNGTQVINQDIGLRIRGASTRRYESKSLTVYARADFGDADLDYPFFSDLPYQSYERLTLSNSGSDFRNTMFRDALCHDICQEQKVENENYQPAIVFVNGEYWGILNLRERFDNNYFAQNYGFDNVDLLENNGDVEEGDDDHYDALSAYLQGADLSDQSQYNYVTTQLDPESMADYYIANIFFDNSDWPGNNTQYWRKKVDYDPTAAYGADGRWRWVFHDMDDTFGVGTDQYDRNSLEIATTFSNSWMNPEWSTLWLRKMLQNEGFKNYFINRFADMMNSYYLPNVVTSKMNAKAAVIEPSLPEHTNRWSAFEVNDFEWYTNYQTGFAQQRPAFQRDHIRAKFGIANTIAATLDVSDADHGHIKINTLEITPTLAGVNANPFPWNGVYFANIPVTLTAIAEPGYVFSHWEGISSATTAEITVNSATNFSAKAVFIPSVFAAEESEPVYFWWMSNSIANNQPLTTLDSSYEVLGNTSITYSSSLAGYPFTNSNPLWRKGSMERRNSPTPINYRPEANNDAAYIPGQMRGIQITQPFQNNGLENTMVFNLPTTGFKNIKFSFAAMDEGAASGMILDYSTSETPTWISTNITSALALTTGTYQLFETDFSTITSANDNANFKIRIRFTGADMTLDNGNRVTFNNIALDGTQMSLTYPNPNVFTVGTAIATLVPTTTAAATSFSISGTLPAGLSFDTTNGQISGTPTAISATTTYTITATNAGGSTTYDLIITVNSAAPTALSYTTPNIFTVDSAIADLVPTVTGNVTSYSISPVLPNGLSLNTTTGIISGTPTDVSANATYTITATNAGGSTTFDLEIAVNDIAPTTLTYPTPNVFVIGTPIANLEPTVAGNVVSYSVSSALPSGLSLNATTGVISGTPTAVSAATAYTIIATNSGGSATFNVSIAVDSGVPTNLSYPTPNVFNVGTTITDLTPTVTGNVTSYSISPALSAGLSFNTTTGVISGMPTVVSANTTYTVTAANANGNTTFDLSIAVNPAAPSALSYNSPNTYIVGQAIVSLAPTVTGTVTSYSISPALPAGLSFNATTGVISGTPFTSAATATYTVTATNAGGSTTFGVVITVNYNAPGSLSYPSPQIFTVNTPITPVFAGIIGFVTNFSVSPALPAGLTLDPTFGYISGTPTAVTATATYTITASNFSGSSTFGLVITVKDVAPTNLSYSTPNVYTVGNAISNLTPTVTGNVVSYSVFPPLPAGLSLDATTGVISGTPSAVSATATYTVTATNSGGNATFGISITVNDQAPTALSYNTPNVFTVGNAITALTPTVTGNVVAYSVSPSLPAGLSINATTGAISGTPTAITATSAYTVTATNSGGSTTFNVVITVQEAAPTALSYTTPNNFTVNVAIAPLSPTVAGNITSYSISPNLPAGLIFSTTTGVISGTPTSPSATNTYTVTASNASGDVTFGVVITVSMPAPGSLSYTSPNTFTVGTAISPLFAAIIGSVDSFTVSPALPAGLTLDATFGFISGTPTTATPTATYTVTASNGSGSSSFGVVITVNVAAPSNLSYTTPNNYTVGSAISPLTPTVTGTVTSYSISASLPAGLSFNATTGIISGTPAATSAAAIYTITATNGGGSTSFNVSIAVNAVAPSALSYTSPNTFTVGSAITALSPSVTGTVTSYSVSPSLPAGLSLNFATGVISGTPTSATATATYTVTATNSGGSTTFGVVITVNPSAPTALSYTTPNVFTVGSAISALNPTVAGTVTSYSISPNLPAGLNFNTTTGVISGTPTAISATATYTVTATNVSGSATFGISITVNADAPNNLSYPTPLVFTVGTAISNVSPTVTGTVVSYSISPNLPAGLSFNTTTGVISGTPTAISATTTYFVIATNSGGNTLAQVSITVNAAAPSALSYTTPNVFTLGTAIATLTPTVTGTVTSYSISPNLPAGLTFNTTTGAISGTPTAISATAIYTVTATNSGGSATFGVSITVNAVAPSNLSYPTPLVFNVNAAISNVNPTVSGNVTSYSISPNLPAGLSFNATTGVISGTPTAVSATTVYTITATNSGGSTTFQLTITVDPELGMIGHEAISFAVYPNPFVDHVIVKGIENHSKFRLYDSNGRLVDNGNIEGDTIRFRDLPQGTFLLEVVSDGRSGFLKVVRK
ncbi:putative Ig domain-containing protein [Flavobacterium sp.]|uniref:putative Ig domain-containing protein n=1 Tax=Flavobacterium sp. TaxID=239 RepID=UPI0012231C2F|nr:putative Ig domain-containing protein [Flavobacterium sp.]RZJ71961.1 MAG: T9SS type A sorting domain-containing protein [Flavobacterium sp.]